MYYQIYKTFYPTYEEWKPIYLRLNLYTVQTFYPTYEEWKLIIDIFITHTIFFFLSYLWGMETQLGL